MSHQTTHLPSELETQLVRLYHARLAEQQANMGEQTGEHSRNVDRCGERKEGRPYGCSNEAFVFSKGNRARERRNRSDEKLGDSIISGLLGPSIKRVFPTRTWSNGPQFTKPYTLRQGHCVTESRSALSGRHRCPIWSILACFFRGDRRERASELREERKKAHGHGNPVRKS